MEGWWLVGWLSGRLPIVRLTACTLIVLTLIHSGSHFLGGLFMASLFKRIHEASYSR